MRRYHDHSTILASRMNAFVGSTSYIDQAQRATAPILVLGIGNILVSDEGIGVHVVERLLASGGVEGASVIDGGTGGFVLLSLFHAYKRIVLVDASNDGKAPGTVSLLRPRFVHDFPPSLGAHDIGLRDLIVASALTGEIPDIHLITVTAKDLTQMNMTLSPEVEASIDGVCALVKATVAKLLPLEAVTA